MSQRIYFGSIVLALSLALFSPAKGQTPASTFVDQNGVWRWTADKREVNEFGVNYTLPFAYAYWAHKQLNVPHEKAIDEDIYHISRLGLTAYRVHVWDSEISDTLGNLLDNDHLRLLDYTLKKMKDRGFTIVLTPIAFWDGYPEKGEKLPGFSHKYGKNNSYTQPDAIKAAEQYLAQFMNHVNRYTGIAYKNDPAILAFEISNEPEHPTGTLEETTRYINRLVSSIRNTGCQKPLFYCMAFAYRLLNAYLNANVQGGSVQWYSFGLVGGQTKLGNFLTNIDQWPKDSLTRPIKASKKALMAYEFDAADNGYTYTYPVMAREFRKENLQFATMFTYDPLHLAYANTEYQTHFMNLAYAPQKALSLKIAGEAFHRIPMGKTYGRFPADTLFDAFRVSYSENLAEMRTDEKFMYANSTQSRPPAVSKLNEVAGYGSSSIVTYEGKGAYFLDKLETGIWRLEVMPDAIWVSDPFARPNLAKEVSAILWNSWPMTIHLPDLGEDYRLTGINGGNSSQQTATNKQVNVTPGTYLLVKKGLTSKWKPTDKWKNITLNEFVAPPPTTNSYLLHQPTEELTKGSSHTVVVDVVAPQKPDSVNLFITSAGPRLLRPIPLIPASPYTYWAAVPDSLIKQEGILKYQVVVQRKGQSKTYPDGVAGTPLTAVFPPNQYYTTRIANPAAPICLLDVAADYEKIRKPHRRFNFDYRPSLIPGKLGVVMAATNISYTSFFFRDKISGRKADLAGKQRLLLRGTALQQEPVTLWVSFQLKDGSEWADTLTLTDQKQLYELSLTTLKRVLIKGPGERGPVSVSPFLADTEQLKQFSVTEAETIKLTVAAQTGRGKTSQAVVEYITVD